MGEEFEIEYEEIPSSSLAVNMFAGALAGITEHSLIYPIDAIKVKALDAEGSDG